MEGQPYWLYTDASDEAAGCTLQQVQPIKIRDLRGTKAYDHLKRAYDAGQEPPKLTTTLSTKIHDSPKGVWGETFNDMIAYVEHIISYWSRMFKGVELRYSTTEWGALTAKEGLVKFQPFIEGEKILLITDHSALWWARTYENSNRQLAAWGTVFSVYAPNLDIIHCAGRVHSNVDPLSHLPRLPPNHTLPAHNDKLSISTQTDLNNKLEGILAGDPTMSFMEDQSTSMLFSHLSMPSHQPLSRLSLLDCIKSNSPDQLQPQKKFKTLEIGSWAGDSLLEQSSMHSPIMYMNSENMENTLYNSLEQFLNPKLDVPYSSMRPLGPLSEDKMTSCSLTMEASNTSKLPASQITGQNIEKSAEICCKFNSAGGCRFSGGCCKYQHKCQKCSLPGHCKHDCKSA